MTRLYCRTPNVQVWKKLLWRMKFFFSPMDNIYIWIDQTPNLEMQLGDLSLFWRLWLLKYRHWQYVEREHDGWVVYTNALYSGDPELKSQPRDWLSWMKFFYSFLRFIQKSSGVVSQARPWMLASTSFQTHSSLIILPFNII